MQETTDKAQQSLERTIKLFHGLEAATCKAAVDCEKSAEANASFTRALGLLIQAKGEATFACNAAPEISANFGGK